MKRGRRIAFTGTRQLEWEEFLLPEELEPHQVLIQTLWSAISSGTETAIYAGTHIGFRTPDARYPKYPYQAGYAATGKVLAVGPDVPNLQVGQIVSFPGKHATVGLWNVRENPI